MNDGGRISTTGKNDWAREATSPRCESRETCRAKSCCISIPPPNLLVILTDPLPACRQPLDKDDVRGKLESAEWLNAAVQLVWRRYPVLVAEFLRKDIVDEILEVGIQWREEISGMLPRHL
jgi:hypothetical protein